MKKMRRSCALFLALALALGLTLPALPAPDLATAAGAIPVRGENDQYFGRQLTASQALGAEARAFYDALVAMATEDGGAALRSGQDRAVALSEAQVQSYLDGQLNLGHALTTGRDAFYLDYPDLFYINFNNFALRARSEGGATRIYITPGTRGSGYLLEGIGAQDVDGLVQKYDGKLAELVQAGRDATQQAGEASKAAAQVRAVHDKLAEMLTYKLDNECDAGNQKYIRTAYGIVTGEGVCEAYARAFKSAMDELDIPCVLVEGAFRHSAERIEAHMWALVQVEGAWYGVDVTMDDPDEPLLDAYGEVNSAAKAYNDYLLAGDVAMGAQHAASATLSAARYEFSYPALAQNDYSVVTLHDSNGLKVRLDKTSDDLAHEGGDGSGTFYVSYNGMSYTEAAKHGYYILAHFMTVDTDTDVGYEHFTHFEGTGEWSKNEDWSYLATDLYEGLLKDGTTESMLPMPHVRYVQFAVTDVAPGDYMHMQGVSDPDAIYNATHYQGDPALLLAKTDVLENEGGTYVAPPYIEQAWPTQQSTMLIGQSYEVEAKMDDKLVPEADGATLGYDLKAYAFINGKREEYTAEKYCTIGPLSLKENEDGTSSITFTFRPSDQWAHDTIFYEFSFTGVVGEKSHKKPNSLVYLASHPCSAYSYQSQGFDWNLYGKPQLMDDFANSDVSISDWTTKDGTPLSDALKHRMTLVVTDTTPDQTAEMEALAQKEAGEKPLDAQTYSINLTVCKSQIVRTGQAVRVMLGFPEGYGPDDAGVTFKAYHYIVDKQGRISGVEEIPCIVTPQGLLVLCSSFSPFSICTLPAAEGSTGAEQGKTLVVSTNCGGGSIRIEGATALEGAQDIYTIEPGGHYTVSIAPPEGLQISAITLAGQAVEVTGRDGMDIQLDYEQLQGQLTGILDVQFATAEWIGKHEGDTLPTLPDVAVTLPGTAEVAEGEKLEIEAEVEAKEAPGAARTAKEGEYIYTFKWFKDGEELEGHAERTFTLDAATPADAGTYQVEVALSSAATGLAENKTARSGDCVVTVQLAATPTPGTAPSATPAPEETATPAATVTPAPTPKPAAPAKPTAAPKPTAKPTPAVTPAPTVAPAAPQAPAVPALPAVPAATARPGGSGKATAKPTAAPSPTPSATPSPTPTVTPAPTATPSPTPTVAPTPAPAPGGGVSVPVVAGVFGGIVAVGAVAGVLLARRRKPGHHHRTRHDPGKWDI